MFEQFDDVAHGTVVEVGAGIGTFSERLLRGGVERLVLVEPDPACARVLRDRFGDDRRVLLLREALPGSSELDDLGAGADLVLCQNVLEHIADDGGALAAMARALRPGGTSCCSCRPTHDSSGRSTGATATSAAIRANASSA